jgi:hypothetical protein
MHRELPPLHPVFALIEDHAYGTLSVNQGARKTLVPTVFNDMDVPFDVIKPVMTNLWKAYHYENMYVPNDLKLRGVEPDTTKLREYDYARDTTAWWAIIGKYVKQVLENVYGEQASGDAKVANDAYLQNWVKECSSRIPGFPANVKTVAALTDAVTMALFTATVQHSAVNYLQEFWGGYAPMGPSAMHGHMWPKEGDQLTSDDLLLRMPSKPAIELQHRIMLMLSAPTKLPLSTEWGNYARKFKKELGPALLGVTFDSFMKEVSEYSALIAGRVKQQAAKPENCYAVLEKERIGNSIHI